jgi:hypothetical protein
VRRELGGFAAMPRSSHVVRRIQATPQGIGFFFHDVLRDSVSTTRGEAGGCGVKRVGTLLELGWIKCMPRGAAKSVHRKRVCTKKRKPILQVTVTAFTSPVE